MCGVWDLLAAQELLRAQDGLCRYVLGGGALFSVCLLSASMAVPLHRSFPFPSSYRGPAGSPLLSGLWHIPRLTGSRAQGLTGGSL